LKLRTLVIGNSGSGKSSLAEGLGALIHAPVFDLDLIHWKDDGFGTKQDEDMARQKVANLAATQRWVIEGVYGWLPKSQCCQHRLGFGQNPTVGTWTLSMMRGAELSR
jgi:adenylate kinase family enzyme